MTYEEVLAGLKNTRHKQIMVTGPQRSGTTICTKMLASDLGFRFVAEEEFNYQDMAKFMGIITQRRVVVQAPCLSAYCHTMKNVVIVFMHRCLEDILKSQSRINWQHDLEEKSRYFCTDDRPVAEVKYNFWEKWQKPRLIEQKELFFELDYNSLAGHRLWVCPEIRAKFHSRQTAI